MALNISFGDFDTVCYSNQHNIIELINNMVAVSLEISLFNIQIGNLKQEIDDVKDTADDAGEAAGDLSARINSLTLRVNSLETDLTNLQNSFNVFSYAVASDINSLSNRVSALEG